MAGPSPQSSAQLSEEMLSFTISRRPTNNIGERLGRILLKGKRAIETPNYIALTSRGIVPHLSQDNLRDHANVPGVYVALEDFIEKSPQATPPVYSLPASHKHPFRRFIALHDNALLVLGPRRAPPVLCPTANTNSGISILTSVGFGSLSNDSYIFASQALCPDITVGLADVVYGATPGLKRIERMGDRTDAWLQSHISSKRPDTSPIFAPLLPIELEQQSYYLDQLVSSHLPNISGLALYSTANIQSLPSALFDLPRLYLGEPRTPYHVLNAVSQGVDLVTIPFLSAATDAGIALAFRFPAIQPEKGKRLSLGVDMWSTAHSNSLSALQDDCDCYACTAHHRAYLQHLLVAKEMLGWVLLQIHNLRTMDMFFQGIRNAIANSTFETDVKVFERSYEAELPEKTGLGPRVRGYQFKSEGGDKKKNDIAFRVLDEKALPVQADDTRPASTNGLMNMTHDGFGDKELWGLNEDLPTGTDK